MNFSSVVGTFNFKLLKKREIFLMKIRTLQCEIQRLKIQTMVEISKNSVSPSVTLFEKETHFDGAGSVFNVHKCAKMVASITKIPFCTEEVPVIVEGQNFSSIRYMDPIQKICIIIIQSLHATRCTQILSNCKTAVFNNMENR